MEIVEKGDECGLSDLSFALRINSSKTGISPQEKYTGAEPQTIKKLVINKRQSISESTEVKLTESDFKSGQDSSILVRERTRGSKLQGAFRSGKESCWNNWIKRSHSCRSENQHTLYCQNETWDTIMKINHAAPGADLRTQQMNSTHERIDKMTQLSQTRNDEERANTNNKHSSARRNNQREEKRKTGEGTCKRTSKKAEKKKQK